MERKEEREMEREVNALKVRSYKWLGKLKERLKVSNGLLACFLLTLQFRLNHEYVIFRA